MVGIRIAKARVRHGLVPFDEQAVDALAGYLFVGMLAGARLFYVLVYDRAQFAAHPGLWLDR
jgi:prolipoprotein diacylglyceryltransferase